MPILHVPSQYATIALAVAAALRGDTIEVASGLPQETVIVNTNGLIFSGLEVDRFYQQYHTIKLGAGVTTLNSVIVPSGAPDTVSIFRIVDNSLNDTIRTGATNDFVTVTGGHDIVSLGAGFEDTLEIDWRLAASPVVGSISKTASTLTSGTTNSIRAAGGENFSLWLTAGDDNVSVDTIHSASATNVIGNVASVRAGAGNDTVRVNADMIYLDGGEGVDHLFLDTSHSILQYFTFTYDLNVPRINSDLLSDWYGVGGGSFGKIQGFEQLNYTSGYGENIIATFRGNYDDTIDLSRSLGRYNEVSVFGGQDVVTFSTADIYLRYNLLIIDYSASNTAISGSAASGFFSAGIASHVSFIGVDSFHISTGAAADTIVTGDGEDYLDGGKGADVMNGGLGEDRYVVDNSRDVIVDNGGVDTIESKISFALTKTPTIENLSLLGTQNLYAYGNALANDILGNYGNNILYGGADKVVDHLNGSYGNDTYIIRSIEDVVYDFGGMDTIQSSISLSLSQKQPIDNLLQYSGIENLVLVGTANINGTGDYSANHIWGNSGNNILDGMDVLANKRIDILEGGLGDDTYVLGDDMDIVIDTGGIDTITSLMTRSLVNYNQIENLTLLDAPAGFVSQARDATGNELENILTGNSRNNVIEGLGGSDTIIGGLGNDKLAGGEGNDKLFGGTGNDTLDGGGGSDSLYGGAGSDTYYTDGLDTLIEFAESPSEFDGVVSSVSFILGSNFEGLGLLETGDINGTGNELRNSIQGNMGKNILRGLGGADYVEGRQGDDQLYGDEGKDILVGGTGNDLLTGGADADLFVFDTLLNASNNVDTITDMTTIDSIGLDSSIFNTIPFGVDFGSFRSIATGSSFTSVDNSDRIIYFSSTGALYYDGDGSGLTYNPILFAKLTANTSLDPSEFVMLI
jgi:Ca2+-binding RTX toxin-like protein